MTDQSPTLDNLAVNVDFGALKARLARGEVHDPDFRALPRLLPTQPIILDVGANIGQSLVSLRALFPQASIHSFEANPILHATLERVSGLVGGQVHVHSFGLSDSTGSFELLVPVAAGQTWLEKASLEASYFEKPWVRERFSQRGGLEKIHQILCRVERGDSIALAPHAIKIDVEGSESKVVRGLESTIRTHLPVLLVENSDWDAVTSVLARWDYVPLRYYPESDELRSFEGQTTNAFYVHRSRLAACLTTSSFRV